jgi:hypothetical protein
VSKLDVCEHCGRNVGRINLLEAHDPDHPDDPYKMRWVCIDEIPCGRPRVRVVSWEDAERERRDRAKGS